MLKPIISLLLNLYALYLILFVDGRFALWVGIIYLAQFIWKHIKDKPVMTITVKKKKADSRKRGSFTGSFLGKRRKMGSKKIGAFITLDGEKQFRQDVTNCNKSLSILK